jgi:ankyrin repeat protein
MRPSSDAKAVPIARRLPYPICVHAYFIGPSVLTQSTSLNIWLRGAQSSTSTSKCPLFHKKHKSNVWSIFKYRKTAFRPDKTCLRWALIGDAPRVASYLVRSGADLDHEMIYYPDLTPVYLALVRPNTSTKHDIDIALRIACSYALPRTVEYLLSIGANPNTINHLGIAAIHLVLMRRSPLPDRCDQSSWKSVVHATLSVLLHHGADVSLATQTTRIHTCDRSCWKSFQCDHRGQTALHLAAMGGFRDCVNTLLLNQADLHAANADGLTPLYGALCQGNRKIACVLLRLCGAINPIVAMSDESTALHVACRFADPIMVHAILLQGADANVVNSKGLTPLHEVLLQKEVSDTGGILETLKYLARFSADPDAVTGEYTPRQLAAQHPSPVVRDMFTLAKTQKSTSRLRPLAPLKKSTVHTTSLQKRTDIGDHCSLMYPPLITRPRAMHNTQLSQSTGSCAGVTGQSENVSGPASEEDACVSVWTESKTAQVKKYLQTDSGSLRPTSQESAFKKSDKAFPALVAGNGTELPKGLNENIARSTLFWQRCTQGKTANTKKETSDVTANAEARKGIQQASGRRKSKKWIPLHV